MHIVVLGRPGAGKGTQVQRLAERLDLDVVSASDVLRTVAASETALGSQVHDLMTSGALVPDHLVEPAIAQAVARSTRGVVLDGFPRTLRQCDALATVVPSGIDLAIDIDVPPGEVLNRIGRRVVCPRCRIPVEDSSCARCGALPVHRADDEREVALRRLWTFERETAPVAEWFDRRGRLVRVDGVGTADEVAERVLAAVSSVVATA